MRDRKLNIGPRIGATEVVRQPPHMLVEPARIALLDGATDRAVQRDPLMFEQAVVRDFFSERMLEAIRRFRHHRDLLHESRGLEPLERPREILRRFDDVFEHTTRKLTTDHGGHALADAARHCIGDTPSDGDTGRHLPPEV